MAGDAVADPAGPMKRFYKEATAAAAPDGFSILLDGRPVRTPGRRTLSLPTKPLAEAVAEEWNRQGDRIDPRAMPLTGLANAAIDRVAPDRLAFAAGLAAYGESDLLCYRAESPDVLVSRQAALWDPILAWARGRFDIDFELVCGLMHRAQPDDTADRLRKAVEARSAFELAALFPLVTIGGSLVAALALVEQAIDPETVWEAVTLDETWQAEQWGQDAEAERALAARRADFDAAGSFLRLLGG